MTSRSAAAGNGVRTFFAHLLGRDSIDVSAQAMAVARVTGVCIYVLDPSAASPLRLSGSSQMRVPNCGVQVNSTTNPAVSTGNSSSLTTKSVCAPGGVSGNVSPKPDPKCRLLKDPLANLPQPTLPTLCDVTNVKIERDRAFSGGTAYCGRIDISSGARVTFEAGIHYFVNAELVVSGSAQLTSQRAMLYFDRNSSFNLSGSSVLSLTAPESGTYHGVAIFASRNGVGKTGQLGGTADTYLKGTIYGPTFNLLLNGDPAISTRAEISGIIANRIEARGSVEITVDSQKMAGGMTLAQGSALVQ